MSYKIIGKYIKELNFNLSSNTLEDNFFKNKNYNKEVLSIPEEEIKLHKEFIKKELKKNFY